MLQQTYPCIVTNRPVYANQDLEVFDRYTLKAATRVAMESIRFAARYQNGGYIILS